MPRSVAAFCDEAHAETLYFLRCAASDCISGSDLFALAPAYSAS